MQKKGNDFQGLGICNRLFNFIMNSLIGRGLKRLTLGHLLPDQEVQEPLTSQAKSHGEERVNSKLKDELDPLVKIQFKQTEELDDWTPIDKLGKKEIPLLNGISADSTESVPGEGSTGPQKIIIPIADGTGKEKKRKKVPSPKVATPTQPPDGSTPVLTGLGLNINEISEAFIQNTKERMSRNISLMEPDEES